MFFSMKTLFAILATTLVAVAQVQTLPAPVQPFNRLAEIDPATGLPIRPTEVFPGQFQPDVSPVIEEFYGPGRYQITPAQITVDGKAVAVVLKLDTITGQTWHLQWTQNPTGRLTANFVEVEGIQRPRPGFGTPGGGGGFPGGVINPVPGFREGGPARIPNQPNRPEVEREFVPPSPPSPVPQRKR